jgi:RNA polymerase sigma-70 factor (ECF subfamily)
MSGSAAAPSSLPPDGTAFAPTQWSVVLESRRDSANRRAALERLCRAYWLPIYGYLRRRGHAAADAEDLTQGFFLYLLEGDFLDRPDPAKGRFRGYLIGALRHYVAGEFKHASAGKRGGGAQFIDWTSLDAEQQFVAQGQAQPDPSKAYETSWALTVLANALQRLEQEQADAGRARQFSVLKGYLSTAPTRGEYDDAALTLGTTRANVAVWIFRLNRRYAELVRLEVAASLQDPAEVKSEMRHLLQALQG